MTFGMLLKRGVELRLPEIWPECGRDDKLSVRNLPEKKITHAHLTTRADEQVRIGIAASVKIL